MFIEASLWKHVKYLSNMRHCYHPHWVKPYIPRAIGEGSWAEKGLDWFRWVSRLLQTNEHIFYIYSQTAPENWTKMAELCMCDASWHHDDVTQCPSSWFETTIKRKFAGHVKYMQGAVIAELSTRCLQDSSFIMFNYGHYFSYLIMFQTDPVTIISYYVCFILGKQVCVNM